MKRSVHMSWYYILDVLPSISLDYKPICTVYKSNFNKHESHEHDMQSVATNNQGDSASGTCRCNYEKYILY